MVQVDNHVRKCFLFVAKHMPSQYSCVTVNKAPLSTIRNVDLVFKITTENITSQLTVENKHIGHLTYSVTVLGITIRISIFSFVFYYFETGTWRYLSSRRKRRHGMEGSEEVLRWHAIFNY